VPWIGERLHTGGLPLARYKPCRQLGKAIDPPRKRLVFHSSGFPLWQNHIAQALRIPAQKRAASGVDSALLPESITLRPSTYSKFPKVLASMTAIPTGNSEPISVWEVNARI